MPKKGGSGSRKSLRVEEKAAQEAEQAAAVVDAQTAAKEAQAAADAAAEELAVYRAETASAAEAAAQKAAAELSELKEHALGMGVHGGVDDDGVRANLESLLAEGSSVLRTCVGVCFQACIL